MQGRNIVSLESGGRNVFSYRQIALGNVCSSTLASKDIFSKKENTSAVFEVMKAAQSFQSPSFRFQARPKENGAQNGFLNSRQLHGRFELHSFYVNVKVQF